MRKIRKSRIIIVGIVVVVLIIVIGFVTGTESFKRTIKTIFSDYTGGLDRTVTIYDINGNESKTYTGKFDVSYDDERIIFDDENGKRHIVFIKTGYVTIDEN